MGAAGGGHAGAVTHAHQTVPSGPLLQFRNVTKPGNEQGTTLRNGSTHHRVPQQKKTKA